MDEVNGAKAEKAPDVDRKFLDAMEAGLTDGDVKAVDEHGRPIKVHYPSASKLIRDRERS